MISSARIFRAIGIALSVIPKREEPEERREEHMGRSSEKGGWGYRAEALENGRKREHGRKKKGRRLTAREDTHYPEV
ncbi:hypothetical protein Trydic_g11814 [Trypoxylus dichotomus]